MRLRMTNVCGWPASRPLELADDARPRDVRAAVRTDGDVAEPDVQVVSPTYRTARSGSRVHVTRFSSQRTALICAPL